MFTKNGTFTSHVSITGVSKSPNQITISPSPEYLNSTPPYFSTNIPNLIDLDIHDSNSIPESDKSTTAVTEKEILAKYASTFMPSFARKVSNSYLQKLAHHGSHIRNKRKRKPKPKPNKPVRVCKK